KDPIDQVQLYKKELLTLYLASLKKGAQANSILTSALIFTGATQNQAMNLFAEHLRNEYYNGSDNETVFNFNPILGNDCFTSVDITKVFPGSVYQYSRFMNENIYKELKNWLVEPSMPRDQRTLLGIEVDAKQKALIEGKNPVALRRIRGSAGSGKSVVLVARANELIMQGKVVLIVTYNITLINYLRDLAVRWKGADRALIDQVTWLNFHNLCARTCMLYGLSDVYKSLWRSEERSEEALGDGLANLVNQIDICDEDMFDAILVDEGQDFRLSWWDVLRNKFLRTGGEMLLVADSTQDIYGTASAWTDEAMTGAGFSGPWNELSISYRLPFKLLKYVQDFAKRFLPVNTRIIPEPRQEDIFDDTSVELSWVQTRKPNKSHHVNPLSFEATLNKVLELVSLKENTPLSVSDITILVPTNTFGVEIVKSLGLKGIRVINTFKVELNEDQRRKKLAFYMGDASIKATTIHSFKGWESKALIIYTGDGWLDNDEELAMIYTSLTRLKIEYGQTSYLSVISDNPKLLEYGRTWPNFSYLENDKFLSVDNNA
ncbi:MAG: hypothetical protein PF450_03265, partial [Bacteroidales bacterium]|nr:hypothetical protein [Bacteroidales bacterium]